MKRLFAFLLTLMMLTLPAAADVAYEPPITEFYEQIQSDTTRIERTFLANGEKGYVSLKTSPSDKTILENYTNGTHFWVYCSYEYNGTLWGYIPELAETPGWIEMSQISPLYIGEDFLNEHRSEVKSSTTGGEALPEGTEYFYYFRYPGSTNVSRKIPYNENENHGLSCACTWKDDQNRSWGYLAYYQGLRKVWVCLEDPTNPDPFEQGLDPENPIEDLKLADGKTLTTPLVEEAVPIPKKTLVGNFSKFWPLVLALVIGCVTIAGLLLFFVFRKKKEKE